MAEQQKIIDIQKRLERPIVLIGMMGVGKTKLARLLSDALHLGFVDSDSEIESAAGMTIKDIFDRFGESYFRDGEKRVIKRLLDGTPKIIATGGGAVITHETADLVFSESLTIWVKADLDIMAERTAGSDKRPLLNTGDHKEILQELMKTRYPVYERADITIENHNGSVPEILSETLDKIDLYLLQSA